MIYRFAVIVGGYVAACLVAGLVFLLALALKHHHKLEGPGSLEAPGSLLSEVLIFIGLIIFIGSYVGFFALPAAPPGIIYAERKGVSSIIYYAIGGVVTGIVSYGLYALLLILGAGTAKGFVGEDPLGFVMTWIAGFGLWGLLSGLTYWLVAGRGARRRS